jgi:hypothetical protein
LKYFAFLLSGAVQATVVIFVQVQTGDHVAAMIVALAAVFFQLIVAFAVDLI